MPFAWIVFSDREKEKAYILIVWASQALTSDSQGIGELQKFSAGSQKLKHAHWIEAHR